MVLLIWENHLFYLNYQVFLISDFHPYAICVFIWANINYVTNNYKLCDVHSIGSSISGNFPSSQLLFPSPVATDPWPHSIVTSCPLNTMLPVGLLKLPLVGAAKSTRQGSPGNFLTRFVNSNYLPKLLIIEVFEFNSKCCKVLKYRSNF